MSNNALQRKDKADAQLSLSRNWLNCLFQRSLPKSTSLTPPSAVRRMLLPLTSRWIIRLLCKCWRPFELEDRKDKVLRMNHDHIISHLSLVYIKIWCKGKLYKRTPTAVQEERHSSPPATLPLLKINPQQALWVFASHLLPNISSFAAGHLTNRALYKMYEITGSCRRWPRMSRPLMSSVTEPPLHSWEGDREIPPSLTTPDYDSWGELAHTQVRGNNTASYGSM